MRIAFRIPKKISPFNSEFQDYNAGIYLFWEKRLFWGSSMPFSSISFTIDWIIISMYIHMCISIYIQSVFAVSELISITDCQFTNLYPFQSSTRPCESILSFSPKEGIVIFVVCSNNVNG